jgi:hypothetical protein
MRNPVLKALLVLVSISIVAITVFILIPPTGAPPPLPASNAYSNLVQAAHSIAIPAGDFRKLNHEQLQALVASNSAALRLVRSNLEQMIQVPLEYSVDYNSKHLADVSRFRGVAMAFLAEGQLAQMEKRPADAAKSCLDTFRLGVDCCRGGVLIDALVGEAIEEMGTADLPKLVDQLDQKSCKEMAQQLEDLDHQKQSWEQTLKQERYWSHKTFPGIQHQLASLMLFRITRSIEAKGEQKFKTDQMNTRKLMIHLAARAYYLENGHPPTSTGDLAPNYLSTIPLDPFTDTNMTYLP